MTRSRSKIVSHFILAAVLSVGAVSAQDAPVREIVEVDSPKAILPEGESLLGGILVNNNGDATDVTPGNGICETAAGNGVCTLRAAVAEANATVGHDIITFDPSVVVVQVMGQLSITTTMSIIGNGLAGPTIQNVAPLSTTSRVMNITNVLVNLHGLTITGGNVTGNGGGIQNAGTLTIVNCVIEGNNANGAAGAGGGIRSTNTLNVFNSTIAGNASIASTSGGISFAGTNLTIGYSSISANASFGNGGGLNVAASAFATIDNSLISNNTAGASSGGLFLNRGSIHNTTISGNTANGALATDGGGGVRVQAGTGTVTIVSCTITGNSAPNAVAGARSGVWHETGTLNPLNTIIAGNVTQDIQRDGTSVVLTSNYNLIGENTSVEAEFPAGLPSGTNYVGTNAAPLDPGLGPLANNGGPTRTHALEAGSIAIDKGHSLSYAADQRRFFRLVDLPDIPNSASGDGGDIGAYEFQSTAGVTVTISGQVAASAGGAPIDRAIVTLTDGAGNSRTAVTNPFGQFEFNKLEIGVSYVITVERRGYRPSIRVVTPDADVLLFIGLDP